MKIEEFNKHPRKPRYSDERPLHSAKKEPKPVEPPPYFVCVGSGKRIAESRSISPAGALAFGHKMGIRGFWWVEAQYGQI